MDYASVIHFSETWGLVYLFGLFLAMMAYAFWPGNKKKFDEAAMAPFHDGDDNGALRKEV